MRNDQGAVAWARNQWAHGGESWYRMCLAFVHECWAVPARYPTALSAWQNAEHKHPYKGVGEIPLGAPVFSNRAGDQYGHVFIAGRRNLAGQRIFYSNDVKRRGGIDPVTIDFFPTRWGHTVLGWTEDLNGFTLPLDRPLPDPHPLPVPHRKGSVSLGALVAAAHADPDRAQGGTTPGSTDDVRIVESALMSLGFLPRQYASDGSYGSSTVQAYKRWQQRCGFHGKDADGIPGQSSLAALGRQFGFAVVA